MKRLFACTLMLFAAAPTLAADANGYTAQYECRAGGPNCNVDVAALGNRSCDQTIAPSTPWSSINWSNNTICLEAGNHTGKGTLTLGSNGTSGARKVLRYFRATDNDDEPWNQSGANQAKIHALNTNGKSYWIIHRLTLDADYGNDSTLWFNAGATNNIANRLLVQRANNDLVYFWGVEGNPAVNNTLQNSVIRDSQVSNTLENDCVTSVWSTNSHLVNNEIYSCNKELYTGADEDSQGLIAENNDLYDDSAKYTDCNGNTTPGGPCGISEAIISLKSGSFTSSNPVKLIHNRIWGARETDTTVAQASVAMCLSISSGGTGGVQPSDGNGASYVLFKNNICFDSAVGILNYWNGPQYNSVIGNIIYKIHRNWSLYPSVTDQGGIAFWRLKKSEFYLNTLIDVSEPWLWLAGSTASDIDLRCNVAIASVAKTGSDGAGIQYDSQAYYGTTDTGESSKIANSLTTRANSTTYSLNAIIRTAASSSCINGTESACFLYKVTAAGTSAGSAPTYCTTLGCTTNDGAITVEAIRGPYTFYRKLRTNVGKYAIPYAKAYVSAPETNGCPSNYASRQGVGINN